MARYSASVEKVLTGFEHPSGEIVSTFYEMREAVISEMVEQYRSGIEAMPWRVIPSSLIRSVWQTSSLDGFVRHEKNVSRLEDRFIQNTLKLWVNTAVFGHMTSDEQDEVIEILKDAGLKDKEIEPFSEWAVNTPTGWRITDVGLDKLIPLAMVLLQEDDFMQKIAVMDRMLLVSHQRSDLAAWFVEGGNATLDEIAEWVPPQNSSQIDNQPKI